jgi:cell division transport system ATP-binding protein
MISFRSVSYSYPNSRKKILTDTSFEVAKGDFAVIKGTTGAGKSTILHLLSCEAKPDAGEIHIGEFELSNIKRRNIPSYRRTIGCVFQDFKLLEEKTVGENVAFALEVQRKYKHDAIAKKTEEILERVGIANERDHFPRELSEGSRQRAAIARALVTEPLVLVADGAASQLDEETAAGVFGLLGSENIRGMTILLTTATEHFFPVFPKSARYFELHNGRVDEFLPVSQE